VPLAAPVARGRGGQRSADEIDDREPRELPDEGVADPFPRERSRGSLTRLRSATRHILPVSPVTRTSPASSETAPSARRGRSGPRQAGSAPAYTPPRYTRLLADAGLLRGRRSYGFGPPSWFSWRTGAGVSVTVMLGARGSLVDEASVGRIDLTSNHHCRNITIRSWGIAMSAETASSATLLIVEDDPAIREILRLLMHDRYNVVFAEDGPPALDMLRTWRPDMVLLDLGLPGMDGFDVLSRIRATAPGLPVTVLTATVTTGDVVRAMRLGAFDYVTKPFRDEELLTKIGEALSGRLGRSHTDPRGLQSVRGDPGRPRCLVLAGHIGTAGSLKLVLERYVTTDVATEGISALRMLGVAIPHCMICDDEAWDAQGSTLVSVLRSRDPTCRVILFTRADVRDTRDRGGRHLVDVLVPQSAGLPELVRQTLFVADLSRPGFHSAWRFSGRVLAVMDYLRLRYAEEVTVEAVAGAIRLSRSRLAELFQTEVGVSVMQYVMALRVEVAKLLLARASLNLEEVATLAGFCDASHFSRVFREHTGSRPGAYRQEFARM
jgi:DNA-binding response OmpR family regulator